MASALERALGTATAAERERRFLLTAIAHDLRTPLFTLRGSLEAIERGIGDERSLTRAQDKAAHLDRLVGDLFAFSRAEYAREERAAEPVDLDDDRPPGGGDGRAGREAPRRGHQRARGARR